MALTDDKILKEWVRFIEGYKGLKAPLFEKIEERIIAYNAREIQWKTQMMQTQGAFFIQGGELEFMTFRHARMADFLIHATCVDFGDNSIVAWFLTCEPTFLKRWLSKRFTKAMGYDANHPDAVRVFSNNLTIPNRLGLRGFVTAVHDSMYVSMKELLEAAGKDTKVLDDNYRGRHFLEAW